MSTALSPLVSEFETEEQEASYNAWLQIKLQEARDNKLPTIPHDQVMSEVRALLQAKKQKRAAN